MKTAYTIIEPGPLKDADALRFDNLTWVDVEFKKDEPGYEDLKQVLDPLFNTGSRRRDWEQVRVQGPSQDAPEANMFVDDMGRLDGMPANDAATMIYWTAMMMGQVAKAHPGASYEELFQLTRQHLVEFVAVDRRNPRIHGRAVLFRDRVWF